jgi:hypothetical protein
LPLKIQCILEIRTYQPNLRQVWNAVVDNSINGTFILKREYLEYHGDRFVDSSLVFFDGKEAIGVFPAEAKNMRIHSYRGLTYAGWIVVEGLSKEMLEAMVVGTIQYFRNKGFQSLEIKSVPDFLCSGNQKELLEAIAPADPKISDKAIFHSTKLPCQITDRGRIWGLKKANAFGLQVVESDDFSGFWVKVLEPHLKDKFQNKPVHSLEEILLLKSRFPNNIKIYTVEKGGEMVAGTVLFLDRGFLHTQYIGSSENGRKYRALDLLFTQILEEFNTSKKYLSLGTSSDSRTGKPIPGLITWKESFGAVAVAVPIFYWDLS